MPPRKSRIVPSMKYWKLPGALVSPKGIIWYSKCQKRVLNAGFYSSPLAMRGWQ